MKVYEMKEDIWADASLDEEEADGLMKSSYFMIAWLLRH